MPEAGRTSAIGITALFHERLLSTSVIGQRRRACGQRRPEPEPEPEPKSPGVGFDWQANADGDEGMMA